MRIVRWCSTLIKYNVWINISKKLASLGNDIRQELFTVWSVSYSDICKRKMEV
jgi:hypothetical protein